MKKEIFPIITFVLLTIGSVCYVLKSAHAPVDPSRVQINENGKEEIILNQLEKNYLGKWYLAWEGDLPYEMKPRKWEGRYWELKNNGKATRHLPSGKKISFYWKISESDSIFSLISMTNVTDTVRYKIYFFGEDGFNAYMFPNELRRQHGHYVGWKKIKIVD